MIIRINNRKILNGFFENLNLSDKYQDILRIIDKMEKVSEEDLIDMLKEINLTDEIVNKILSFVKIKGSNENILNSLKNLNIENEITEINPGDSTCLNIIFHPDDIGKFQREILLYGNFDSSPKLLTITGECF